MHNDEIRRIDAFKKKTAIVVLHYERGTHHPKTKTKKKTMNAH